ncbi:MAG TPA: glycosyltransferase family 4 protein [Bryobacteraceae bacterium]|nr:glycosyltransferase family 4 protein [Bryobacteraceae bacterium]
MNATNRKILFVHNAATSFVQLDLKLLKQRYEVDEWFVSTRLIDPLRLWKAVRSHDLVFGWFASWHTFLPMLFARIARRPSVLVTGGYDVANLPEIGYGLQRGGIAKWLSRWTMRLSTRLVANSDFSRTEARDNAAIPGERVTVIYHGLPSCEFSPGPRARMALTVGNVTRSNLTRKGLEAFVRAAALLPDIGFVLAGEWQDDSIEFLKSIASPNVEFPGRVDDRTLQDLYRRASVYVQVSKHEGFGMSLAEAMMAGCIPVVINEGAIPEVAGDCGVYAGSRDAGDVAAAIRSALGMGEEARLRARARIENEFTLERRRNALEKIVDSLLEN